MRIALVCRGYPTHRPGGMPHVVEDRAVELARQCHDVHVLTTGLREGDADLILERDGVHVNHLSSKPLTYTTAFADACAAACRALRPNVIHLDSFDRDRLWWAGRPGGSPLVSVTMHGFGIGAFLTAWNRYAVGSDAAPPEWDARGARAETEALALADVVIAISWHERWALRDVYGLRHVELVYNPIAPYFFEAPAPAPATGYVVAAGNPGTSGNRRFALVHTAAQSAGVKVRIVTGVHRCEMPAVYDGARVLALPTLWAQGYDLTVAEAVARGRPVIMTATGSYLSEGDVPWVRLIPRDVTPAELAQWLASPPPAPPPGAADRHRPDHHVAAWLEAVT